MKKWFIIVMVIMILILTSCASSNSKDGEPLSEIDTSELEIMLDETWLSAESTHHLNKAIMRYTKCATIELELLRRAEK